MSDKPKKIIFEEGALDNLSEEERENVINELKDMLISGDFIEQSRPIEQLPSDKIECPECGEALVHGPVLKVPDGEGNISAKQVFDCFDCDRVFLGEPVN